MAKLCKPYIYDAIDRVLYIDLVFWEGLTVVAKMKIVELSDGDIPKTIDEPFSIVIRENATFEKYQETFSPVISNVNRVCGSLCNRG